MKLGTLALIGGVALAAYVFTRPASPQSPVGPPATGMAAELQRRRERDIATLMRQRGMTREAAAADFDRTAAIIMSVAPTSLRGLGNYGLGSTMVVL